MTVNEIADRIRKEVESLAKHGEDFHVSVNDAQRIQLTLRNPIQGLGFEINASNCEDVGSVMKALRSDLEARVRANEEYEKALLDKCKSDAENR